MLDALPVIAVLAVVPDDVLDAHHSVAPPRRIHAYHTRHLYGVRSDRSEGRVVRNDRSEEEGLPESAS